jgi:hypothetical protein
VREAVEVALGYAWQALDGAFPARRLYGYLLPLRHAEPEEGPEHVALHAARSALAHATAVALEAEDEAGRPGLVSVPGLGDVSAEDAYRAVSIAADLPQRPGHDEHPWLPPRPPPIPPYGSGLPCDDPWLDPDWAARLAFDAWASAAGRGPADPDDPFWARVWDAHGAGTPLTGRATATVAGGLRIELDGGPAFLPGGRPDALGREGRYRVSAFSAGAGYVVLSEASSP